MLLAFFGCVISAAYRQPGSPASAERALAPMNAQQYLRAIWRPTNDSSNGYAGPAQTTFSAGPATGPCKTTHGLVSLGSSTLPGYEEPYSPRGQQQDVNVSLASSQLVLELVAGHGRNSAPSLLGHGHMGQMGHSHSKLAAEGCGGAVVVFRGPRVRMGMASGMEADCVSERECGWVCLLGKGVWGAVLWRWGIA